MFNSKAISDILVQNQDRDADLEGGAAPPQQEQMQTQPSSGINEDYFTKMMQADYNAMQCYQPQYDLGFKQEEFEFQPSASNQYLLNEFKMEATPPALNSYTEGQLNSPYSQPIAGTYAPYQYSLSRIDPNGQ